jgi:hypothetical protein
MGSPQQEQDLVGRGILTATQQAELAQVKKADDYRVWAEKMANDARFREHEAEIKRFWDEHYSPKAQEAQREAKLESDRSNQALIGGITSVVALFTGASFIQSLNDPTNPGGGLLNNILSAFGLGSDPKAPTQQVAGLKPSTPTAPSV